MWARLAGLILIVIAMVRSLTSPDPGAEALGEGIGLLFGSCLVALVIFLIVRIVRGKGRGPASNIFVPICACGLGLLTLPSALLKSADSAAQQRNASTQGQNSADESAAARAEQQAAQSKLISQNATAEQMENQRRQLQLHYQEFISDVNARADRNPNAFQALSAEHYGPALALRNESSDLERLAGGFATLLGASYCSDHADECNELKADLEEMDAKSKRLEAEMQDLTNQVGQHAVIQYHCAMPSRAEFKVADILRPDLVLTMELPNDAEGELISDGIPVRLLQGDMSVRLSSPADPPTGDFEEIKSSSRTEDGSGLVFRIFCR
jgi:hypothetical protein